MEAASSVLGAYVGEYELAGVLTGAAVTVVLLVLVALIRESSKVLSFFRRHKGPDGVCRIWQGEDELESYDDMDDPLMRLIWRCSRGYLKPVLRMKGEYAPPEEATEEPGRTERALKRAAWFGLFHNRTKSSDDIKALIAQKNLHQSEEAMLTAQTAAKQATEQAVEQVKHRQAALKIHAQHSKAALHIQKVTRGMSGRKLADDTRFARAMWLIDDERDSSSMPYHGMGAAILQAIRPRPRESDFQPKLAETAFSFEDEQRNFDEEAAAAVQKAAEAAEKAKAAAEKAAARAEAAALAEAAAEYEELSVWLEHGSGGSLRGMFWTLGITYLQLIMAFAISLYSVLGEEFAWAAQASLGIMITVQVTMAIWSICADPVDRLEGIFTCIVCLLEASATSLLLISAVLQGVASDGTLEIMGAISTNLLMTSVFLPIVTSMYDNLLLPGAEALAARREGGQSIGRAVMGMSLQLLLLPLTIATSVLGIEFKLADLVSAAADESTGTVTDDKAGSQRTRQRRRSSLIGLFGSAVLEPTAEPEVVSPLPGTMLFTQTEETTTKTTSTKKVTKTVTMQVISASQGGESKLGSADLSV
jgi:hypothetical protein